MENTAASSIHVESSEEGFAQFDAATSDPGQQARIQNIHLEVLFPATSVKRLKKMQSNAETAANSAAFTRATAALFEKLANWGPRGPGGGIKLTVTTRSLNLALIQELVASGELDQAHNEFGPPIWDLRHSYRYIQFTPDAPPLPKVACVSELDVGKEYHFHPSVLLALSSSLDRLERLEWRLRLPGRRQASERREIRSALAHALQHVEFPPTLATLEMYLADEDPGNEHFDPGSFGEETVNVDDTDDLSLAVRRICQLPMIRTLNLHDHWILSPVALGRHASLDELHCPSLQNLSIDCARTTPGGQWTMSGDPEAGIEEDGYWDSDAEEEEPAAFDSDDSDTSDYAPEFEWDKEDGLVPGMWFRFRPEPPYYVALLQSLVDGVMHGMPSLHSFTVDIGKNSRAPLELKYSPQVDDEGNGPCWDISVGRDFDRSWEMPAELRRSFQGPDGNIGLRGDLVNQPTEGVDM
ncbi:hypothetical protein PG996_016160 [Apiospora saccharicola]|uniref:F-box domain-containing protein n=1 Tax=Apiospora saccharicola TaxID=335842 RepID=A0ABR1TQF6_9PEZI